MTVVTLHPRLGTPSSYTVHPSDPLLCDLEEAGQPPQPFDPSWAVEFTGRCIEVLAGERYLSSPRYPELHPRVLAHLRAACGSRAELRHPRILRVSFQGGQRIMLMAGVVRCGAVARAFTAEFRPTIKGWWLTHLGVI